MIVWAWYKERSTDTNKSKQAFLHALDKVFHALTEGDNTHLQEPASIKKLLKGNGY